MKIESDVTVLIPHHGDFRYLERAVHSVSEQTRSAKETILVLDRPDQALMKFLETTIVDRYKVSIVESPGEGIVDALNFGLKRISTKFVARLDSDDQMDTKRLELQENFLVSNPKVGVAGTQLQIIDDAGHVIEFRNFPKSHRGIMARMQYQNCIGHPSVMMRTELVKSLGGYRKYFTGAEDYDLWLRLSEVSKLANLDRYLTKYRISELQYTRRINHKRLELDNQVRYFALQEIKSRNINPPSDTIFLESSASTVDYASIPKSRTKQKFEFATQVNSLILLQNSEAKLISKLDSYLKVVFFGLYKSPITLCNMIYWKLMYSRRKGRYEAV